MADAGPSTSSYNSIIGDDSNCLPKGTISQRQTSLKDFFTNFNETEENENDISNINNYLRGIQSSIKGERTLHDVLRNITREQATYFLERSVGKKFSGGLYWYVFHEDHAHIVHDCSYASGKCRCSRIQCLPIKGKSRRHHRNYYFSERYFYNLTKYLLQPPRQFLYIEIAGRTRGIPNQIGNLSYERYLQLGKKSMVESSGSENEFSNCIESGPTPHSSRSGIYKSGKSFKKNSKYSNRSKEEELLEFFKQFPSSPLLNILNSSVWLNSKFKFFRRSDPTITTVFDVFSMQFIDYTVQNIYDYSISVAPLYASVKGNINEYYYDEHESLTIAIEFLQFQFNNDEDLIKIFLIDLYIIDKKIPKVNAMQIIAPPSAGKNYFLIV
ncbi:unnamed protein product [Psylliodes chrysocephalus]|uniref:Uncharacterized protein n=1 Tax=Psylliodes chrysocephalus TaxID=3402493 RepID=A0A9P0GDJ6_9CUCU|nr:unnamed protein product [Psylliodes chrysocephala]